MNKHLSTYGRYFGQVLTLSYPIIIGQLGMVMMGVADVIMIGRVDATNLAAAGIANAVYFLVSILGMGTLTAISPLVAKAKGAGHANEAALLHRQGIRTALLLGVLLTAILYVLSHNMHWFGQSEAVTKLAGSFLGILNCGTIVLMLFTASKQFSDGLSYTKPSAVITIFGVLLNVVINYLLIYGNYGFPQLGLDGAGIATSLTRLVMMVSMTGFVYLHPQYKAYLKVKDTADATALFKRILVVGIPSGLQYFAEIGAFATAAIMIGWFSESQLAAHNIAINLASVTYMVATGLSAGGAIAVGNAWGRKDKTGMIRSGKAALMLSTAFMGFTALLFALCNHFFVSLYLEDMAVAPIAANLLLIAALFQLSDGIQCVSLGILRGIADTRVPTVITIIAYWVVGLPVGLLLAYQLHWDVYGIWAGLSVGLTFSAVLLTLRFLKESKQFNFKAEQAQEFETLMEEQP